MAQLYYHDGSGWVQSEGFTLGDGTTPNDQYVLVDGQWVSFGGENNLEIDNFSRGNLDPYYIQSLGQYSGISSERFYGDDLENAEVWSTPGDGLNSYPRPGIIHQVDVRMDDLGTENDDRYILYFGGNPSDSSNEYPRYQVNLQQMSGALPQFDIEVHTPTDSWEVANASSSFPLDEFRWYTIVFKWYDGDRDGRTGVRGELYDRDDFKNNGFNADLIVYADSEDHNLSDGSDVSGLTEEGRFGMRISYEGQGYFDNAYNRGVITDAADDYGATTYGSDIYG